MRPRFINEKKIKGKKDWVNQWKTKFNPDPISSKHNKLYFHGKRNKPHHPDFIVNGNPVKKTLTKNIWECLLIVNLTLMNKLKECFTNIVSKSVDLIHKL